MPIGFNTIPANLVAPIFAFEVNSGGQYEASSRLVLLGHKTTAGSLAAATPARVSSLQEAAALTGPGSMLYNMWVMARRQAPVQDIWVVPVAETGAAATWTITVGTVPAAGGFGLLDVEGERLGVTVVAGDSATTVAASIAAAINGMYDPLTGAMLHVTAASASNVVTVTARHTGALSGETDIHIPTDSPNVFATSCLWLAAGGAGSGVPTLTAALAALGDDPADMIVLPWTDSTSLDAVATALNDTSGRWAPQRMSFGHALGVATGNTGTLTSLGLGRNDRHITVAGRLASTPTPSWIMAAGFAAAQFLWLQDVTLGNVSRNQTNRAVLGLKPPRDRSIWPAYATRDALLRSGISTWQVDPFGTVMIDKFITMNRLGAFGQPDTTFRDIQSMFQASGGLAFIKASWQAAHGQKALADRNPRALLALTTFEAQAATIIAAYIELCARGVFENPEWFAKNLRVERDPQNSGGTNAYLPIDRVNPGDIFAANATFYSQAPAIAA